jgi:DNA-binding NtrC family response regulator
MPQYTVLVADDHAEMRNMVSISLQTAGYQVLQAADGQEAIQKLLEETPHMAFMDIYMPEFTGLEVLKEIQKHNIQIPVIFMTGSGDMSTAIEAVHLGAYDYLPKPVDPDRIKTLAKRALEQALLKKQLSELKQDSDGHLQRNMIIGHSTKMQEIFKLIGEVTMMPNETTILITGESGTGKELVARAIHNNSKNAAEPFVAVNCAVLPENLLESELFGHEKGAFTSADKQKLGKFEVAENGTIFLDEIANMTLQLQQKLLRVLQEREFTRLGGNETLRVNARFVTATNKDLKKEIEAGNFMEDLYYRIRVIPIHLPPLRERKEDISLILEALLQKIAKKSDSDKKMMSPEALKILESYHYPGNVRELENIINRAVMLERGEVILPESLPDGLGSETHTQKTDALVTIPIDTFNMEGARAEFEKSFLETLLSHFEGNVTAAAKTAEVHRTTLQRMINSYSIDIEAYRQVN